MEKVCWRLVFTDGNIGFTELSWPPPPAPEAGTTFDLRLYRRTIDLGPITGLKQTWVDRSELSPKKGRVGGTCRAIVSLYYEFCRRRNVGTRHQGRLSLKQLMTYTLARLLPYAAPINLNRIIDGSTLGKRQFHAAVAQVETTLTADKAQASNSADFRRRSEATIAPRTAKSPPSDEIVSLRQDRTVKRAYGQMIRSLANAAREDIKNGLPELPTAIEVWQKFRRKARRVKTAGETATVVDVLSAEARASFVLCYSAFWDTALQLKFALDADLAFQTFHRLWHTEMIWPDPENSRLLFTLFSGSCFALHPAGAILISSQAGRHAIGAVASLTPTTPESDADQAIERFLHAMYVAVDAYSETHREQLATRKEMSGTRRLRRAARPSKRWKGTRHITKRQRDGH